MEASKKKIGIFGGTFDPVHNGHLSIAKSFLRSGFIDTLWILLTPSPPHKEDHKLPYALRFKMLSDVFESIDNVIVSDVEQKLSSPSYTVNTIEYLQELHPEYQFYLCLGKDSYRNFENWHRWQKILEHTEILVAERPIDVQHSNKIHQKITPKAHFIDHAPVNISSTEVRKRLKKGEPVETMVPASVLKTISKNNLYQGI